MTNTYIDKSYAYAVARLRSEELKLLDKSFMEQLISAKDAAAVVSMLHDKGWGSGDPDEDTDELLAAETGKLWAYVDEIVPDLTVFDVFRLQKDYNNIKAAIKESKLDFEYPGIYADYGTLPSETVRAAIRSRNYKQLPADMAEIAEQAHDVFLRTGDGQLCDIMVDKACLEAMREAGRASGDAFIEEYAELKAAAADIKIALRAKHTAKDRDFLEMALSDSSILSVNALITAALGGDDAIAGFLQSTDFAGSVQELKASPAAFERWCDNLINDRMQSMHYDAFGAGPIAAYIIARENEIKSVGIIISARQNGFDESRIRERVRDTYV